MNLPDARTGYLLFEAFDLLGRHLFGCQWKGYEATARRDGMKPDAVRAKLARIDGEVADLERRIARAVELRRRTLKEDERDSANAERQRLVKRRSALELERMGGARLDVGTASHACH